jgi:membrane protein required for colicin V production
MQFQILDFIVVGIMLLSGILALARGFTREVLSLIAWGLAAVAAYFAIKQQQLIDMVLPYVDKPILAQVAVGAIAFLITLILVSVISVKISDRVVDSAVGAFDRTLGFIYGLARGLVLVAIAYMFYGWLQPPENQEDWIRNAQSLPVVRGISEFLVSLMPPDIAETLSKAALPGNAEGAIVAPDTPDAASGGDYTNGQQQGLENLIEGQSQTPSQPATQGQTTEGQTTEGQATPQ